MHDIYVSTLFVASIISFIVVLMALRRRNSRGAVSLVILMSAIFIWTIFQALSFIETDLKTKLIFANMRYFGIQAAPLSFYALAYGFRNLSSGISLRSWFKISVFPTLMLIALWTNPLHYKFYLNVFIDEGILILENGPLFWANMIYLYAFVLLSIFIFIKNCIRSAAIYRTQAIIIAAAASIPVLANLAFNMDILPVKNIDITPFSFFLTGIFNFYAIFQFKLLDIVPIAKDRLFEDMDDMVIVIDQMGRVLDLNRKARGKILEETDVDYVGKDITLVLKSWSELCECILKRKDQSMKINFIKNGTTEYYDISISDISNEKGRKSGELIVLRNITELEEALLEARKSKELAEQASTAKGFFLANMSHEIRTPLNAVIGVAEILDKTELSKEEQKEYIKMIMNSAEALLTLLNDVLDFSKIDAGKMEMEKAPFDIKMLVKETVGAFSVVTGKKGLKLDSCIADNVHDLVIGDMVRVRQILINLLSNSIKFTERGTVEVRVEAIKDGVGKTDIAITISDTGIGIPKEKLEGIFESFKQVDNSTARKFGGTGLGLSIVKKLLELMGGTIKVESEPGIGSSFSCIIPFVIPDSAEAEAYAAEKKVETAIEPLNYRVLLAEDNKTNRKIMEAYLKKLSCTVDFAEDGSIALNKLQTNEYDAVLMDIQMPQMDGLTATKIIRASEKEAGKHIPIIALTAGATKEDYQQCIEAGMDDHISKPIKIDKLYKALRQHASKK